MCCTGFSFKPVLPYFHSRFGSPRKNCRRKLLHNMIYINTTTRLANHACSWPASLALSLPLFYWNPGNQVYVLPATTPPPSPPTPDL